MAEVTTSGMAGTIKAPSAIELFWERNRRLVNVVLWLIVIGMAAYYAIRYFNKRHIDQTWSSFATVAKLDAGYASDGQYKFFIDMLANQQGGQDGARYYFSATQGELVTRLPDQIKTAEARALEEALTNARGSEREPLLAWVAAGRAFQNGEFEKAKQLVADAQTRFPNHFLFFPSDYPVQYRVDRNADVKPDPAVTRKPKPDLAPPVAGSAPAAVRAAADKELAFRAANPSLYQPQEPEPGKTYVIKFTGGRVGECKVRLYWKLAPKHCASFDKLAREKFFEGMNIDELKHKGTSGGMSGDTPAEFHFGLRAAKDDLRTNWVKTTPSEIKLDFEDNQLSHFPGCLAAATEAEGKSSGERIWINATDAAKVHDGTRVIFGKVVEGLDTIEAIANYTLESEEAMRSGTGKPRDNIKIESITILD